MRARLTTVLFRVFLRRFLLLWVAGKIANAATAAIANLSAAPHDQIVLLGFRPVTELGVCAVEMFVLWAFMRRNDEDLLYGNLGLGLPTVFVPLLIVHMFLSAALALVA